MNLGYRWRQGGDRDGEMAGTNGDRNGDMQNGDKLGMKMKSVSDVMHTCIVGMKDTRSEIMC